MGEVIEDQDKLLDTAMQYFLNLFQSSVNGSVIVWSNTLGIVVHSTITEAQKTYLTADYTEEEVKMALLQMDPWKAPGSIISFGTYLE